jgi:LuxR family maltose regulon positive regulatory protein
MTDRFLHGNAFIVPGNQVYLERPRIDRLLEKAAQCPIVIVEAGAGYGKSQAVYSFVRRCNVRATWLQFSAGDNVSERFWENFVETISVLSRESADRLAEIGFPATERQYNRYMTVPRTDIVLNEKYVFVYDDIHLIHNKSVLEFIGRTVILPFPNITSIIISRNEPALNLSAQESLGHVAHITEEDLRFSRDETVEYFYLMGLQPVNQTVSAIYNDTEGWAFATHLAGLSLKNNRSGNVYVPQALRSNIFKLMESEIIAGLSGRLRTFLIKLSLIEHPVPDLLREIAGGENKNYSLIDEMEQIGSFIQYDTYLNAYRIHHLFLDYLRGRQYELSEAEKREVWDKAAGWCLRNNYKIDAIIYYEKAGDYLKLLNAIYTFPLAFSKPVALLLLEIMERAPAELYETTPAACIILPRLFLTLGMFERAEKELLASIARLETKELNPDNARSLAGCYNTLGFLEYVTCIHTRDYRYVRHFERAHYYSEFSGHKLSPPMTVFNMGSYCCRSASAEPGDMERFNEAAAKMVMHITASMNGCGCGMDDLARGEMAFFRGDMVRAEEYMQKAIAGARERQQYEIEDCGIYYYLRICLCRGNGEAIPGILARHEALLNEHWYVNRFVYHDIVSGWFYVQTGRPEKVAAWLKSNFEESDVNSLNHGIEIVVKAKYHFAEKRYPAVLAELQSRKDTYGTWSWVLARLEAKVLEAASRYRLNDRQGAFRDLEAAWELARGNGLYMPFAEMGKDMRALAGAALKEPSTAIPRAELEKIRRSASLYAKNLFLVSEQYRADSSGSGRKKRIGSALSPRETDVLTGLSQGLTREEIAKVFSISINTVKSAARSVYNKLGALNRADAVRIATEKGIL